jgi:hypothetical protein
MALFFKSDLHLVKAYQAYLLDKTINFFKHYYFPQKRSPRCPYYVPATQLKISRKNHVFKEFIGVVASKYSG